MNVDLTITGRVESLHLEEGDRILVTFDENKNIRHDDIERILETVRANFPGHEVVCLYGLSLSREKTQCA